MLFNKYTGFGGVFLLKHFKELYEEYVALLAKDRFSYYEVQKIYYAPQPTFNTTKQIGKLDGCDVDISDVIAIASEHGIAIENINLCYEYDENGSTIEVNEIIHNAVNQHYAHYKAEYDANMKKQAVLIEAKAIRDARITELCAMFDGALAKLL